MDRKVPAFRPIKHTSRFYWAKAQRLWHWLLLSLPVDLCFLVFMPEESNPASGSATALLYISLLLAPAVLLRERLIDAGLSLFESREKFVSSIFRWRYVIIVVFGGLTFIEILYKFGSLSVPGLVFAVIVTAVALKSVGRSMTDRKQKSLQLEDFSNWVEHTNFRVFALAIAPPVGARLLSLVAGILAVEGAISPNLFGVAFLLSASALFATPPLERLFISNCRRCSLPTSRVLKLKGGLCPACLAAADAKKAANDAEMPPKEKFEGAKVALGAKIKPIIRRLLKEKPSKA